MLHLPQLWPACSLGTTSPPLTTSVVGLQICSACTEPGTQPDMQPCVVCLNVASGDGQVAWCHDMCLPLAVRRRAEKRGLADWKCDECSRTHK